MKIKKKKAMGEETMRVQNLTDCNIHKKGRLKKDIRRVGTENCKVIVLEV